MSVNLIKIPNPFQPEINSKEVFDFVENKRLDQYIQDLPWHDENLKFVISVNGHVVTEPYQEIIIYDGDIISACAKTEVTVASAVASWVATALFPASLGIMGSVVGYGLAYGATFLATSFAIGYGMSMLASALAPDIPDNATGSGTTVQSYGWGDLQQTHIEGVQIPYIFGANKISGHIINQYIDIQNNNEILYMQLGICDHAIDSITDVRINDQPSTYYQDVTLWTDRLGSSSDTPIPEFGYIVSQIDIGSLLTKNNSIVQQTDGDQVTHLKIIVTAPGGLYTQNNSGGFDTKSVSFTIEYRVVGSGTWLNKLDIDGQPTYPVTKSDNTSGAKRWSIIIAGLTAAQYEVRVTRTSDDPGVREASQIYFTALQEIIIQSMSYPGLAKYAIKMKATDQLSGGKPAISCIATRANVSVWNLSAWVNKRATNPAWMVWWLLHHSGISVDKIIYEDFSAWADYCDETVGGGYRFNYNVIVSDGNFWDEIQKIAKLGRAAIIRRGSRYGVFVDRYEGTTPVISHMFTMGNIIDKTYNLQYLPTKDRANAVEVEYTDTGRDYTRQVITVYSDNYIESDRISQKASVSIQASTTQATAVREGIFRINSNNFLTRVITFDAFMDSFACVVGDLFYFQHEIIDYDTDASGRIVSATSNSVTLDRAITIVSGNTYKIMVRLGDGTFVEKTITNAPGIASVLTLSTTFATTPVQFDLYMFGRTETYKKIYRLVGATRADDFTRTITGLEYVPEVYTTNDGFVIDEITNPGWMTGKQLAIGVHITEFLTYAADGSYISALNISWHMAYSQKATNWDVWLTDTTVTASDPVLVATVTNAHVSFTGTLVVGHSYLAHIVVSGEGAIDTGDNTATITIAGKLAPPADVLNFSASWNSIQRAVNFTWTHINDIDLDYYEIRQGATWATATKILETKDSAASYYVTGAVAGTITYLIKAIDTSKIESATAASYALTFDTSSTGLSVPTGLDWTSSTNIGTDGTDTIMMLIEWDNTNEASSFFAHYVIRIEDTAISKVTQFICKTNFFQVYALPNHSYTVAVAAVDKAGNQTAFCTGVTDTTTKDATPPAAPTALAANGTFTNIILTWSHGAEADLDHFIVFRNTENDPVTAVQVGTAVREFSGIMGMFTDTPPTDDEYWYWVAAVDSSGNISDLSASESGDAPGVLVGTVGPGAITATEIADDAVTTPKILANAITSVKIAAGQIGTDHLVAGAVTAGKINVTSLSAINANIGTITAGRIQNAANTTYLDLTNDLFSLGGQLTWNGSSLSIGGAISGSATINGTSAATVVSQASAGAYVYSNAGSLAWQNNLTDSQANNLTTILGGKITTSMITGGEGSYYDLVHADARIGSSAGALKMGGTGYLGGSGGGIWLSEGGGNQTFGLTSTKPYLTSYGYSLDYNGVSGSGANLSARTNLTVSLGQPSLKYNTVYADSYYATPGHYYDVLDDLDVLHSIKPDGIGRMDLRTLPKDFVSYEQAKEKLKKDSGDLLSGEDIDEMLSDPEDMGHLLSLNLGEFTSLIEGAVRQLDKESSDLIQQMADWTNDIDKRLKNIEKGKTI